VSAAALVVALVVATIIVFRTTPAAAAPTPSQDTPAVQGTVQAVVKDAAGRTYIGGNFTSIGPRIGKGARMTATDASPALGWPDVAGGTPSQINATAPDGDGGWYIGGNFTTVGGVARTRLAHILPNGILDPNFNVAADNPVWAMAVDQAAGLLYVGGQFTTLGGASRARLGRISTIAGLVDIWNPGVANGQVNAIGLSGTGENAIVYVAGSYSGTGITIGGAVRQRLAAIPANNTTATSWNPCVTATVSALAVTDGDVYVGGSFSAVNGTNPSATNCGIGTTVRQRIARFPLGSSTVDTGWNPCASGTVNSLTVSGTDVYLGGAFTTVNGSRATAPCSGGTARGRLAKFSTSSDTAAAGWNPCAQAAVTALSVAGDYLYAGGSFNAAGGSSAGSCSPTTSRGRMARFATSDGTLTSWDPNLSNSVSGLAIQTVNGVTSIYAGGTFVTGGPGARRTNLARLTPTGQLDPTWIPVSGGAVINALAVDNTNNRLFIAGNLIDLNGEVDETAYALSTTGDGTTNEVWDPQVQAVFTPSDSGQAVIDMVYHDGYVYLVGDFGQVGTKVGDQIARVSADTAAVDEAWDPPGKPVGGANASNPCGGVSAPSWNGLNSIAVHDGYIYYGGTIGINDAPNSACGIRRVARASIATGELDSTWNPPLGGPTNGTSSAGVSQRVYSFAFDDDYVYVGGEFTQQPNGSTAMTQPRLARVALAGNATGALDPDWAPRPNGTISAMRVAGGHLYAGGGFTQLAGAPTPTLFTGLARISTTTPPTYDSAWLPAPSGTIEALWLDGSQLSVGGGLTTLAGVTTAGFARIGTATGQVRVVHELAPTDDGGRFNLQINGISYKENATDGQDTGVQDVYNGTNTVGVTPGTGTALDDYGTAIDCRDAADVVVATDDGPGPLDVEVDEGEVVTCTVTNTRIPPAVTAISPTVGTTSGGTSVTITGTGFTDATAVTFGGVAAGSVVVVSDTTLTVNSPPGSTGVVGVIVTAPGGTSATGAAASYRYLPPTVVGLSASSVTPTHGSEITLTAGVTPGTPSGQVTFSNVPSTGPQAGQTVSLGSAPISAAEAELDVILPTLGRNRITAHYAGDAGHLAGTSSAVDVELSARQGQLVVRQFRFSGPGGGADQFVELYNTGAALSLAGFSVDGDGATTLLSNSAPTLATGQSYLVAGSAYSLTGVAAADLSVSGIGTDGVRIVAPDTADTVTDAVGISTSHHTGAALPAMSGTPTDQYAWTRLSTAGRPQNTGSNAADFTLVSTTGATVGGVQSCLGTPNPTAVDSPRQQNASLLSTLLDPSVSSTAAPNRTVVPANATDPAMLVVRRTITNSSATAVTSARLVITSLSQVNGPPKPGVVVQPASPAYLRVINPGAATSVLPVTGGGTVTVQNLSIDAPATVPPGGGISTTLTVPLPPSGLAPNASVNISVSFAIDRTGTYWFGYDVRALHEVTFTVDTAWARTRAGEAAGDSGALR
jgi:hypothetical protein